MSDVREEDDDDDRERQPVVGDLVEDAELDERRGVVDVDQRRPALPVEVGDLEERQARRRGDLVDACCLAEPLGVVGDQPDDLAETERHDREVVPAHAQRRCTEQHAGDHGDDDGEREGQQEGQRSVLHGEHADGVGADRVEADVAEVEKSRVADDDVEAERDQPVGGHHEHHRAEVGVGRRDERRLEDREGVEEQRHGDQEDDPQRLGQRPEPFPDAQVRKLEASASAGPWGAHARAFPSDSPRSPVGRNIRIRTRRTKAITSFHSVPKNADP